MNGLQHYQRYQWWYGCAMLCAFLTFNAFTLATSVIMEASRNGAIPAFELWEPFVWEFSSAIAIFILIPAVVWLLDKYPLSSARLVQSILIYSCSAVVFSVGHVALMAGMRALAYLFTGASYHFGSVTYEFLYELRKDVMTFIMIIVVSYAYRFISSRLMGEANAITEERVEEGVEEGAGESEGTAVVKPLDRLLVKKLGKEFIVKLEDVEWMESSGNYVNLHIKERIYPIRRTLGALTEDIAEKGFCRIHRSHAVNLDSVDSITSLPSGDGEVTLKSGKILNISRRYKDGLKQRLL